MSFLFLIIAVVIWLVTVGLAVIVVTREQRDELRTERDQNSDLKRINAGLKGRLEHRSMQISKLQKRLDEVTDRYSLPKE